MTNLISSKQCLTVVDYNASSRILSFHPIATVYHCQLICSNLDHITLFILCSYSPFFFADTFVIMIKYSINTRSAHPHMVTPFQSRPMFDILYIMSQAMMDFLYKFDYSARPDDDFSSYKSDPTASCLHNLTLYNWMEMLPYSSSSPLPLSLMSNRKWHRTSKNLTSTSATRSRTCKLYSK